VVVLVVVNENRKLHHCVKTILFQNPCFLELTHCFTVHRLELSAEHARFLWNFQELVIPAIFFYFNP